jgi:RNA polymerase sigma factor (sigma-70 family)
METWWTILRNAHADSTRQARSARALLIDRYEGVVRRYLLAMVRDPEAAQDLFQEFARGVLSGQFHNVHPEKGRFRNYLKTCLCNLVNRHRARQARQRLVSLPESGWDPADSQVVDPAADNAWEEDWRRELIGRAFEALQKEERSERKPRFLNTVLRLRLSQPDWNSDQMAEHLALQLGKAVTNVWVRKRLQIARERLGQILLEEVARSLEEPSIENVTEELADLGLLKYCEPCLAKQAAHA